MSESTQRYGDSSVPVVHVISDSMGDTAAEVVRAASLQFDSDAITIKRLTQVSDVEQVRNYFDQEENSVVGTAVFHTFASPTLRSEVRYELDQRGIPSIDLIGPAITVMSTLTGLEPKNQVGLGHEGEELYFKSVDAMEFFVEHDDGHKPQDLPHADVVLVGMHRTSKTPISMYLAFSGLKVANIEIELGTDLPKEIFEVDRRRIFGLTSSPERIAEARQLSVADDPAMATLPQINPEDADKEHEYSKRMIEKLGCAVVNMDGRTVEEVASFIFKRIAAIK